MSLGKATHGGQRLKNLHIFTFSIKHLINQNIFSLFYSKGQFLSLLLIQHFSIQEQVRDEMWNFSSQGKQSFTNPKYFVHW